MRHRRWASALAVTLALAGCGSTATGPREQRPEAGEIAAAETRMRALPSVEDSEARLAAVVREIADAAEGVAPALDWYSRDNRGQSTLGCPSPYLETDGVSMTTDRLVSDIPIPDTVWPEVLRRAREIGERHGMTALTVRVDAPGRHDVIVHSPDDGNEISLGTYRAALVSGSTGCRYRATDLPTPPKR